MRGNIKIIKATTSGMVQTTACFGILEIPHRFQLEAATDTHCAATHSGANLSSCLLFSLWVFRLNAVSRNRFQNRAIAQRDLSDAPDGYAVLAWHQVNRDFISGLHYIAGPTNAEHVHRTASFRDPMLYISLVVFHVEP